MIESRKTIPCAVCKSEMSVDGRTTLALCWRCVEAQRFPEWEEAQELYREEHRKNKRTKKRKEKNEKTVSKV